MKKLLLFLALLAGVPAAAETVVLYTWYDLDATTYVFPVLCSPGNSGTVYTADNCPGQARFETRPITTTAAASTTVTAVSSNSAFNELLAGDEIEVYNPSSQTNSTASGRERRLLTARASANSVTVDSNITIPTAGSKFAWWKRVVAATAADGWFSVGNTTEFSLRLAFEQANVTGGITYKVECRDAYLDRKGPVVLVAGETNVTTFPSTVRVNVYDERYAECRVGLKIGTADDGGDTGADQERITLWLEKGGAL